MSSRLRQSGGTPLRSDSPLKRELVRGDNGMSFVGSPATPLARSTGGGGLNSSQRLASSQGGSGRIEFKETIESGPKEIVIDKKETIFRPTVPESGPQAPVIPLRWLGADEQRRLAIWAIGLIEVMKLWDAAAPHFTSDLPTTASSVARIRGPISAALWGVAEFVLLGLISLLRIPGFSPMPSKPVGILLLVLLLGLWNLFCWFVADPRAFIPTVHLFGPVHLGEEGFFWGWTYMFGHLLKRLVFGAPDNIQGIHHIRLLPYSTATINPSSFTYCIPPGTREPMYIPVLFNNSDPDQVAYRTSSLVDGKNQTHSVYASHMKVAKSHHRGFSLSHDDNDEEDEAETIRDLVRASKQLDAAKLSSIKAADSLLAPLAITLKDTESIRFLEVKEPSVVSLLKVVDKHGDRFNVNTAREAVVYECPSGGDFVEEDKKGKIITRPVADEASPELRCIGSEDMVNFQVRGVAPLHVTYKRYVDGSVVSSGEVKGIEDEQPDELFSRVSKVHNVPLRIRHNLVGTEKITLSSVVDGLGNTHTPTGPASTMTFNVLQKRSVSFNCPRPFELLVGGRAKIPVELHGSASKGLSVNYTFTNNAGGVTTRNLEVTDDRSYIEASEPGKFTLQSVGGLCPGGVLEPSTCSVRLIPPPTADISVKTLHECSNDVGSAVAFEFTGTPPYTVFYTEQKKGSPAVKKQHVFRGAGGELVLKPEREGKYTYTFASLNDANYRDIPINYPAIHQVVRPPASVILTGSKRRQLYVCSPDEVGVELDVQGNDPLKLQYRTNWGGQSMNTTVPIKSGKQVVSVPVPRELHSDTGASGKFVITLVSVEDANGCVKRLQSQQIDVDIDRHTPTARFASSERVTIKEGSHVNAALRFTGHGPWALEYTLDGKQQPMFHTKESNSQLQLKQKGTYVLTSVRDAHCPGKVDELDSKYGVDFLPRPVATLADSSFITSLGKGKYRTSGVCAGQEEGAAISFQGASPFAISYKAYVDNSGGSTSVLNSAQNTGVLHLASEKPGTYAYRFFKLTDSNYEDTKVDFQLEHVVHGRPSGVFSRQNTQSLCRDTRLETNARLKLTGVPPFTVTLGVRRPASADLVEHTVEVPGREWDVELDETVAAVGRYEVVLLSVTDASGCPYEPASTDSIATPVDVVETARVVPLSKDQDVCVGQTLNFELQGKAPWIVEYEWLGKRYTVTSTSARFTREAEKPGVFQIHSVALKDHRGAAQCTRVIDGLAKTVHPLPSVRIQDGTQHLHEGDQPAIFGVKLHGTPPFTFTYVRFEMSNGKKRVQETLTISDIWDEEYWISSSLPGDYEVTSVADKYCRFPPLGGREDV